MVSTDKLPRALAMGFESDEPRVESARGSSANQSRLEFANQIEVGNVRQVLQRRHIDVFIGEPHGSVTEQNMHSPCVRTLQ